MKKLLIYLGVSFLLMILSGCSTKEFQTKNYFDALTKDEILQAGKWVFLLEGEDKYVIDSYRDRLEVTQIGMLFHTLQHKDFVLNVEENECGTFATLKIRANLGINKILDHNVFEIEHQHFWEKLNFFLGDQNEIIQEGKKYTKRAKPYDSFAKNMQEIVVKKSIIPMKDLSGCVIKTEFEKGVIKTDISSTEETIYYEEL